MAPAHKRRRGREGGRPLPLRPALEEETSHRRRQQHDPDHRAHVEVLLPDHLLVYVCRQHGEVAAHHLGDAEIGDGEGEGDDSGGDKPVGRPRQRDSEEDPQTRGAQHRRRLVQPCIGGGERDRKDDRRMREGGKHLRGHNPPRPIDGEPVRQPGAEQALVAEQSDHRKRRQQRRCQDRDQHHRPE